MNDPAGISGVISYLIEERRREVGARPERIMRNSLPIPVIISTHRFYLLFMHYRGEHADERAIHRQNWR